VLFNIPRHLFSEAIAATARRATNPRPETSTSCEDFGMDSDQALVVRQKADGCLRTKPTPFPKWDSDRWNDPLHRSTSRGSSPVLPPRERGRSVAIIKAAGKKRGVPNPGRVPIRGI